MKRTVLQIPIDPTLRRDAEKEAIKKGFSTLQDAVRFILTKLAKGVLDFNIEETVQLSEKAIKRYEKMTKDFEKGKNIYHAKDVDDLMRQLHDHSIS